MSTPQERKEENHMDNSTGRKPQPSVALPAIGETVAGAGNSVARPVEMSIVRRVHILACAVLGLDDSDHEDDAEAEPLENAIFQLLDQARSDAIGALQKLYDGRELFIHYSGHSIMVVDANDVKQALQLLKDIEGTRE